MPPAPEGKGNCCLPFAQIITLPAIRFSEKHDEDLGELFRSAISPHPDAQHDLGFFSKILQQFLELHPKHRAQVDDISKRWVEIFRIEFEQAFETLYKLTCTICGDHDSKTARPRENRNGDIICHKCFDAKNCPECHETKPSDQFNGTLCRSCYAKKWENKRKQSSETKECPHCRVTKSLGDFLGKLCRPCSGKDFREKLTQKDDKECPQCKKTKSASLFAGKICSICSNTNRRNKMAKKMKTCPQCNKQKSGDRFNGTLCGPCYKKNFIKKAAQTAQKTRQCATCHETKLVHQFGTSTDCQSCYRKQYYRKKNQTPSAAQKEKVKKANGGKRKTRKSVKKKQADVPSEEDDDPEQEPMSIKRKRKVTKTGGKRESKRLKAEQD